MGIKEVARQLTGFVKQIGDTMTGALTFYTADNTPIVFKMANTEKTVVPSANQYSVIGIRDKNNAAIAKMQYAKRTTGQDDFTIQVENKDGVLSNLQIGVDANGKAFTKVNGSEFGGMDLLWQNASPTSEFASQNVSYNITSHSMFLVIYKLSTSSGIYISQVLFRTLPTRVFNIDDSNANMTYIRQTTCYDNMTQFANATQIIDSTVTNANRFLIPWRIYGFN